MAIGALVTYHPRQCSWHVIAGFGNHAGIRTAMTTLAGYRAAVVIGIRPRPG